MVDLAACLRGEKRAWDALVERVAPIVLAAVRRTLRGFGASHAESDAEDVAQEVFVRLVKDDFRLLRTYDPSRAALSTWLTLVARSVTIDQLRRRRLPTVPLDEAAAHSAPTPPPASSQALQELAVPPDLLSPRQQLVLKLLFEDDLSVEEAARTLGVEAQTVRSTKHKAIEKLRGHFAGPEPSVPRSARPTVPDRPDL